ncbi:hypothetical protein M407DRAFT_18718 [Tulasnella calospora MUT 4182]|uniref:F-box domain-containing protein n=1 Tax=Tulasnella calospora MUT 4182 TaxID=1051891 RepID=A0A0C3LEQ7_9AGAM|nr:hypothetical protein M407DRAFT_18718 [Tulasnella calospora MUT 4182]
MSSALTEPPIAGTIPAIQSPLLALAPELTAQIFSFTNKGSCVNAARSCRGLKEFALDQVWKDMPSLLPLFRLLDELTYTANGWNFTNGLASADWDKFWSYAERVRAVTVVDRTGGSVHSCHLNPLLFLHISAALPAGNGVRPLLPQLTRLTFHCYHPYGTTIVLPLISSTLRHLSISLFKTPPHTNKIASTTFSTLTSTQNILQLDSLEVVISNVGSIATEAGRQAQTTLDGSLATFLKSQRGLQCLRLTPLYSNSPLNQSFVHLSLLHSLVITCVLEPHHGSLTESVSSIASCTRLEQLFLRIEEPTSGGPLSFFNIRPLLACRQLTLFDISHLYPLKLDHSDVVEMGKAWSQMESLLLWTDDFPIQLLPSFATSFSPRLRFLGLSLGLEGIGSVDPLSHLPSGAKFSGLTTLHIGETWVKEDQLETFAMFLGSLCSPGVKVWSGERPYNSDGQRTYGAKQYRQVNVFLDKFFRNKTHP